MVSPAVLEAAHKDDYGELERLLQKESERKPGSAPLLATLGKVAFRNRNYHSAASAFRRSDALAPLTESNRFALAMAYLALGQRHRAAPELSTLTGQHPKTALYPYWLGRVDYDERRFQRALESFEQAIRIEPDFVRAHDRVGQCQQALGDFCSAERAHKRAAALNQARADPSPWPPMNLGTLLLRLDRAEEAIAPLRDAIGYHKRFGLAHYKLGRAYDRHGDLDRAVAHLQRAAELAPDNPKPHYALGRIYQRAGEEDRAQAALTRFMELEGAGRCEVPPQ